MCPSGPSPTTISKTTHLNRGAFFLLCFRFSQLVAAASYSDADVSARPNSLNLFLPAFVGNSA